MAVAVDSVEERLTAGTVGALLCYTVIPYLALLVVRAYVLVKAQALRRSLRRSAQWRGMNEKTKLAKIGANTKAKTTKM